MDPLELIVAYTERDDERADHLPPEHYASEWDRYCGRSNAYMNSLHAMGVVLYTNDGDVLG